MVAHCRITPSDFNLSRDRDPAQKLLKFGLEQVSLDSDDKEARSLNCIGWQSLLTNRFSNKIVQKLMFVVGYLFALLMAPFEQKQFKGSAYTVVFRKQGL